jgi:hypothetical protein
MGAGVRAPTRTIWSLFYAACALGCGASPPKSATSAEQPAAELSASAVGQTRAFTGPEGLRVQAVDLADNGALVAASGVASEATGRVVRCEREQDGPYLYYRTIFHGRRWNVLVRRESSAGAGTWTAYLPGASQNGFELTYAEKESAEINAQELYRQHRAQDASGQLAALQSFDRPAEERSEQEQLDAAAKRTAEDCGGPLQLQVAWNTISDEQLKEKSVSGYCESVLSGLSNICRFESGRAFVKARIKKAVCRLDGKSELALEGDALRWAISFDTYNLQDRAREALWAIKLEGGAGTLGAQLLADQTAVCTDKSKQHMVLVGPADTPFGGLAYGDGKKFYRVPVPAGLGEGWFFDPRQRNEKHSEDFRGYDLRVYSYVKPDVEHGTCKLVCGAREAELSLLRGPEKSELLARAACEPSPHGREPYALARDKQANYYYVDRGVTPETAKDFRLYRGRRGGLRQLSMRDVVSDSEGEVFESTGGRLRLFLARAEAEWVEQSKARPLLRLPLAENFGLIYNELGVYMGQRLGVPCDDF